MWEILSLSGMREGALFLVIGKKCLENLASNTFFLVWHVFLFASHFFFLYSKGLRTIIAFSFRVSCFL